MASDTDLWMSVNKAAQEKYQSSLDAKGSLISKSFELMPCPFTGPTMFCAGSNFLSHPKHLTAFNGDTKRNFTDCKS